MAVDEILVNRKDLEELTAQLRRAANEYESSYEKLENGVKKMTETYFKTDTPVFLNTYNDTIKKDGAEILNIIRRNITYMENKTDAFDKLNSRIGV